MSIASLQSTVDKMSTDDLVEALRDPPTAAKLRNALILAEALLVEPKAGQEQVSAVLEQDIERVASSMCNDDKQAAFVVTALRIDDNETNRFIARAMLEAAGHQDVVFCRGKDASLGLTKPISHP